MSIIKNKLEITIFLLIGVISIVFIFIYLQLKRGLGPNFNKKEVEIGDRYTPFYTTANHTYNDNTISKNFDKEQAP